MARLWPKVKNSRPSREISTFPTRPYRREFFKTSSTTSSCPWKGQARYYTIVVDGQENPDAAWYYPDPKPAART